MTQYSGYEDLLKMDEQEFIGFFNSFDDNPAVKIGLIIQRYGSASDKAMFIDFIKLCLNEGAT